MQFTSLQDFLNMCGYGFFVWLSYGVSAALLIGLFINSLYRHQKVIKQINQRQKREQKLRQAAELHKQNSSINNEDSTEATS